MLIISEMKHQVSKHNMDSMGLKEKTIDFLLFSRTTKRLRNRGIVAKLQSFTEPNYLVVFLEH